jgi:hypothetical protein
MRKMIVVALCGLVLSVAAPAMANTPSQGAYGGTGNNQLSQVQSLTSQKTATTASSTLPFTGLNVGLLAGVAVVLLGAGLVLRIRTRSDVS